MPFKSQAQRKFMYSKHPEIAKRWSKKYPTKKNLPKKLKGKSEIDEVRDYGKKRGL